MSKEQYVWAAFELTIVFVMNYIYINAKYRKKNLQYFNFDKSFMVRTGLAFELVLWKRLP